MNSHDERGIIVPVDSQGNNASSSVPNSSSTSTIKINSLCIKLGFVKDKVDINAEKCSHFSIRGYVSGMRERGSSNLLPYVEELPPMDVPQFKYWLCQSCLRNCGNANTSHEKTPVVSVCDQSMNMIRPCATFFPPKVCGGVSVLPFGEGTSGVKPVDDTSDDDDDDDERVLPAFRVNERQRSQEIHADNAVHHEPITFGCSDTKANAGTLSNDGTDDDDQDSEVKDTIAGIVGPTIQSSQQDDHPNGHTKRKTRKVRLLKELLGGNNEIQQRKKEKEKEKENSGIGVVPEPSTPSPAVSLIKRKVTQPHGQDQRSVDITTPGNACKKAKNFKGNTSVAKTTMVDHSKDPGASEGPQNDKKYIWNKHGTTNKSSNVGKVCSDPVTAWRSIFSDVPKTDNNHLLTACKPTYDQISKDRGTGTGPRMAPLHPEKKLNFSKKMPKNPLKSKPFVEDSRNVNSRPKERQSEREIGLDLSLNYDPQSQIRSMSSSMNRPPVQDYSRKGDFFMGESHQSIPHRIIPSKEGDVSNRHAPRPLLFQEQQPYTYGSYSGHQKLDFSDPHNWNTGIRGYSDVTRPQNHQRQGKMVSMSMGRSDEREIVELMARNQYERSLCESRGTNNNSFIPHNNNNTSGFHNINMTSSSSPSPSQHQDYDYLHMMSDKSNIRNNPFFHQHQHHHQEQVSDHFNMFDGFQQSRNQHQPPSSGIWMPDSSHYNHHLPPKTNKKMTNHNHHLYTQVYEGFNKYNNGTRHHNETTDVFSNFHNSMPHGHGYTRFSDKDNNNNQKSIMDLDLNVVAPNVIEEQHNNFESLNMTSSSSSKEYHPKNLDSSSYPNEAIPAMQLLSLMDAGKSKHLVNTDERKFSKPLSYTHSTSNMSGKTNFQFPNSRYFQSSSLGVPSSYPCGFQSQNGKLTSGSGQVYYKPQEDKSRASGSGYRPEESYVFPVPWHVNEDRSESVNVGPRFDPINTEICTINKNPADFSTPGPENVYMINVEDLVIRREKGNGQKRQKRS